MPFKSYRDQSRVNYGSHEEIPSIEKINCGSLLRIADATEVMAKNYQKLQESAERYERWYHDESKRAKLAERRVASLKGVITKMRKKNEGR